MPPPSGFFRFMYNRESAAWERRRDDPDHRELVQRTVAVLAEVAAPGPAADLGCGPGAHSLELARRGYDVVGVDGAPAMIEVARARAARDGIDARFEVHDLNRPLSFADASLVGVLAVLVIQHLANPAAFISEIRRCLRPDGYVLIVAPSRDQGPLKKQKPYWRLRASICHLVPGIVRFYDTQSLTTLVEAQGMTVIECLDEPGGVRMLARP